MRFTSIGALFVVLSIVIFSTSCKKDEVVAEPTADPNPPINNTGPIGSGINLTTSIGGLVVDEFDTPVDNALITIGNQTTYTNENGQFYVTAISVDSERAYVKVEKTGYFLGARAFNPEANSIHSIKIKLLAKNAVGSFNNNSGGVVVSSGVSLTFEPGDISLQNGTPYNGAVTVFASYLDPTSGDLGEIMPGDLLAKDLNDNVVILETYGMVAVELEGSNGEALNVASGESVQLSMPVSTVQQSNAPNTIPLWYFDEIDGNWIEDGIATLQGSSYIGEVSHFSYWNCDDPYSTVPFGATFGCNGLPIPNLPVSMFDANTDILFGVSYTNSLGQITDPIPANIELDMVVHDQCGNEIFSQNIGVNSSALNLGFVSLCSQASPVAFTGVLQDCNSQPIENGLVNVNIDGGSSTLYSDANGVVNGIIVSCSQNDMVITAYDFQNGMQSLTSVVPFNSSYDAGVINVCDTVDEFVEYTFEGNTYFYTDLGQNEVDLTKSVVGDTLRLFATEQINTNVLISFCVIANSTGTYPNLGWPYVWHVSSLLVWPPGQNVSAGENSIMVNITQFPPNVGDYIEGTFSGAFIDIGSIPRSITGSFRIMRSF